MEERVEKMDKMPLCEGNLVLKAKLSVSKE